MNVQEVFTELVEIILDSDGGSGFSSKFIRESAELKIPASKDKKKEAEPLTIKEMLEKKKDE